MLQRRATARRLGRFSALERRSVPPPAAFDPDPFVQAYRQWLGKAVAQLRNGQRRFFWTHMLFPSPPHVHDLQLVTTHGSFDRYVLYDPPPHPPDRGVVAARAFLAYDGGDGGGFRLREAYLTLAREVCAVIDKPVAPSGPVGVGDCLKILQSARLFERVAAGGPGDGRGGGGPERVAGAAPPDAAVVASYAELGERCRYITERLPAAWPLPAAALANYEPGSRLRQWDRRLPPTDGRRVDTPDWARTPGKYDGV